MRKTQSKDLTSNGNYAILHLACGRGGTGRRVRLRGVWETVWVQVPSTAPKYNDLYIHCASHFFCNEVMDLNGTLRKQHSALFLVPSVITTALAAQKKAFKTPASVRIAEQVPSTAPTEKTITLSSFFHFLTKMSWRCRLFQTHLKKTDKSHAA